MLGCRRSTAGAREGWRRSSSSRTRTFGRCPGRRPQACSDRVGASARRPSRTYGIDGSGDEVPKLGYPIIRRLGPGPLVHTGALRLSKLFGQVLGQPSGSLAVHKRQRCAAASLEPQTLATVRCDIARHGRAFLVLRHQASIGRATLHDRYDIRRLANAKGSIDVPQFSPRWGATDLTCHKYDVWRKVIYQNRTLTDPLPP